MSPQYHEKSFWPRKNQLSIIKSSKNVPFRGPWYEVVFGPFQRGSKRITWAEAHTSDPCASCCFRWTTGWGVDRIYVFDLFLPFFFIRSFVVSICFGVGFRTAVELNNFGFIRWFLKILVMFALGINPIFRTPTKKLSIYRNNYCTILVVTGGGTSQDINLRVNDRRLPDPRRFVVWRRKRRGGGGASWFGGVTLR